MEYAHDRRPEPEKLYGVILSPLEPFLIEQDTTAEVEAQARRLYRQARETGRPPHHTAKPRPPREA
jgi:hypothetical protein